MTQNSDQICPHCGKHNIDCNCKDLLDKAKVDAQELAELAGLLTFAGEGNNDGVVNNDREVVARIDADALYICYNRLTDKFHMIVQSKGKATGASVEADTALTFLNVYDGEAYQTIMEARGKNVGS